MNLKNFVVLRGLPGAGKSTFANLLAFGRDAVIVENDEYMYEDGEYKWSEEKMKYAYNAAFKKASDAFKDGVELVILSNVSPREKSFKRYLDEAKNHGYTISSLVVENRNDTKSIHGVPEETLISMESAFQIKLK